MFLFDKIRIKKSKADKTDFDENIGAYQQRLSLLTTMEYKTFMLLREGFSKKECSQRLNMKRSDVRVHFKAILNKLNVRSTAELIVKYREKSLS